MKENVLKKKSFDFAIKMVKLFKFLKDDKKEYLLSKQLLRSSTSVGVLWFVRLSLGKVNQILLIN